MPKGSDIFLQNVSKIVVFLVLAFALYLFFTGHSSPGGGFIAGLMSAGALLLLALAYDIETVRKVVPFDFKLITAIGLLIALGTGTGALLFGQPFLKHAFGHFDLPLLGDTELHTALIFDLGVYLAVVGVTMTILLTIGEDR
nr:Na(+)/H(+) antiporter subunit B [Saccharibacillus qingshengii]